MRDAVEIAVRELLVGVKEIRGAGLHNARILEYHGATGLGASDDETPWCSSFVNWCLRTAQVVGTNSASARSFMLWGKRALPKPGCIAVLWRGHRDSSSGHVGFYLGGADGRVFLLGGNQGDAVSVAPFPASRVLDYRTRAD